MAPSENKEDCALVVFETFHPKGSLLLNVSILHQKSVTIHIYCLNLTCFFFQDVVFPFLSGFKTFGKQNVKEEDQ